MASSSSASSPSAAVVPPPDPLDAGSELFDSYEVDLQLVQTSLSYELQRLRELSSSSSSSSSSNPTPDVNYSSEMVAAESYLDEADEIIAQMQLEINHSESSSRRFLRTRLKAHTQELDIARKTLIRLRRGQTGLVPIKQKNGGMDRLGFGMDDERNGTSFLSPIDEEGSEREGLLGANGGSAGDEDGVELEELGMSSFSRSGFRRIREQPRGRFGRQSLGWWISNMMQQRWMRPKTLVIAVLAVLAVLAVVGFLAWR